FDPRTSADVQGAVLLGERQLTFLNDWSTDWSDGTWMKVCLSQTIFANVATLPSGAASGAVLPNLKRPGPTDYPEGDRLAADCDSNGWPQTGRNRALRELRRGFAFHVAGDQHLGSFIRYGVDAFEDAGYAFCVPSIANTWPRRWYPPTAGDNRAEGSPKYTGQFLDGFGNHVTVHAVSNPVKSGHEPAALHDRAPGYGIVRFNRKTREIVSECWPRWSDPRLRMAQLYPGWPQRVQQVDGYSPTAVGFLPMIQVRGANTPVVQLVLESTGDIVYALRLNQPEFRAPVYASGTYTLRVGEPGAWRELKGLQAGTDQKPIVVEF
ncbi:MAG: alkaline phosphatase D, partial [Candidatus Paceibacteria bacterium]